MTIQWHVSGPRRLFARVSAGVLVAQFLSPALAFGQADEVSAVETAAARSLAVEGVKLAQSGECAPAVDRLERAAKLRPSAIVLWHLGDCQIQLGRWLEGSENLRKLLREPLPPEATPALEHAHQQAATTLKELKSQIPSLTILVRAPPDAKFSVVLDGTELSETLIGEAIPANPGPHTVEVVAPGFIRASTSLKLVAGSKESVSLVLTRDPFARAPLIGSASSQSSVESRKARAAFSVEGSSQAADSRSRVPAYLAFGAGAVGLAVGIGFGQAAMRDEKNLRSSCPERVCSPDLEDDLNAAKTKGMIATVGFGVGAAGAALGTVLYLTSGPSSEKSARTGEGPTDSAQSMQPRFRPRALIGLGSVRLVADF